MKFSDIKNMSVSEVYAKAYEIKKELLSVRLLSSSGQVPNLNVMNSLKKDYARLMTRLTQIKKGN